jgi:hypothetical protein
MRILMIEPSNPCLPKGKTQLWLLSSYGLEDEISGQSKQRDGLIESNVYTSAQSID